MTGLDWVTGALTVLAMELVGRKHWQGWLVGLMNQALWAALIWDRALWGLAPLCLILTWRYTVALLRWRRESERPAAPWRLRGTACWRCWARGFLCWPWGHSAGHREFRRLFEAAVQATVREAMATAMDRAVVQAFQGPTDGRGIQIVRPEACP